MFLSFQDCLRYCQEQIEQCFANNLSTVQEAPETPTKSDPLNGQPTTPTDVRDINLYDQPGVCCWANSESDVRVIPRPQPKRFRTANPTAISQCSPNRNLPGTCWRPATSPMTSQVMWYATSWRHCYQFSPQPAISTDTASDISCHVTLSRDAVALFMTLPEDTWSCDLATRDKWRQVALPRPELFIYTSHMYPLPFHHIHRHLQQTKHNHCLEYEQST